MRNLKFLALCGLLAAAASSFFGPAQAQTASVADIKATAEAIQTLEDQQKTITDNQAKIDEKLATIAENVRVGQAVRIPRQIGVTMMKRITILPVALLFLSAGVVKSQAPLSGSVASSLQELVTANKALIDKQQKTLDGLDQLDQTAQELKTFAKRS